ncbi:hypothetical protein HDF19_13190 [Mucilaginibacter sp. E4BP6]|uniref:hypothetical protein n=1 Tax=Mucilaginibacter sp. E4BP6 TaxID=2723089 RepID=UPI0015CEE291|nr:hypothetical protein [Mucilaginibacter sp. E4BP6]NYE64868.1 hypothetical protein [Mucilaginibacter sp. E4BP6]
MDKLINKSLSLAFFIGITTILNCAAQVPEFSYTTPNAFDAGKTISPLKPTISKGPATSFSIRPDAPDGLTFDLKTGILSGKPLKPSNDRYCIAASNANGIGKAFQLEIVVIGSSVNAGSSHQLTSGEWFLVFLPPIAFIGGLILLLIYTWIIRLIDKKSGPPFSLRLALSESTYPQKIDRNTEYNATNIAALVAIQQINTATTALPVITLFPTTITTTDNIYRPSISRLIAFLTTMVSLLIGICLSSFFIYCYLKDGTVPDVTKLSGILISMGIGVVPYAFNKISTMANGGQPSTPPPTK